MFSQTNQCFLFGLSCSTFYIFQLVFILHVINILLMKFSPGGCSFCPFRDKRIRTVEPNVSCKCLSAHTLSERYRLHNQGTEYKAFEDIIVGRNILKKHQILCRKISVFLFLYQFHMLSWLNVNINYIYLLSTSTFNCA